jgi:TRAP-type C4-dicarboxylate transport system substrate-binding protein
MVLVAAGLAAALLGACGGAGADKAGGSTAPRVLRLAAGDDRNTAGRTLEAFAQRVARVSEGTLRVQVEYRAAGEDVPDYEARLARMVERGDFDLGFIGSRAWDELGLTSFQALQAPFLIDDTAVLDKVVTSDLAGRMLAGLRARGLEGIALVPGGLRHPVGMKRPLASPEDVAGARVWVTPSKVSEAVIRAIGATPVHVAPATSGLAISRGEIDGTEGQFDGTVGGRYFTADVTFFPRASTLFAGGAAWKALSGAQRSAVREAARQTVEDLIANRLSERELARAYCGQGRVVLAGAANVAAFERATRPVYAELERDRETREQIAAIRALKAVTPASAAPAVPAGCSRAVAPAGGEELPARALDGTYRWRKTAEGARRLGVPPDDPDIGAVSTMTLRDGRWLLAGDDRDSGTFEVRGDRLVFDWPRVGYALTFTFKRAGHGSLDLEPVKPMDLGDQFVWASERWRRVGPPVRDIP